MIATRSAVPDLLKRFVPTPYKLIARGATVETNDLELLEQFEINDNSVRLATLTPNFHMRVIRDATAPADSNSVRMLCQAPVCLLLVGSGTIIMVDREFRKVFAFLASDVSNERFAHLYLPLAMTHSCGQDHEKAHQFTGSGAFRAVP